MTMANILNISGTEIKDNGIRKLAGYVESNLPDDFTLVIGCKPSIYDVDAVLIGMGNIYAIECKDWKGNIKGGTYGWWQKDGQMIENPLQQARNNTVALGKWLRDKIGNTKGKIWVESLLVFTHEEGELHLNFDKASNSGTSTVLLNDLKEWIYNQRNTLNNNITDKAVQLFNQINGEEKVTGFRFIEKALFVTTVLMLILSIFLGYKYINNPNGIFLPLLLLCMAIVLAIVVAAAFLIKPSNHAEQQMNNSSVIKEEEYNPLSDFTNDLYNFFGTYNKR
jgi:hypothetical protein